MKVLVTGANGFLGRYVIQECRRQKILFRALARGKNSTPPAEDWQYGDLRDQAFVRSAVEGVDVVVHLAAAKSGSLGHQASHTLCGTESLLQAMREKKTNRLILVSSFAVYDYAALRRGDPLREASPLKKIQAEGAPYDLTKLEQEHLCRSFAFETGANLTILRPGVLYDESELWNGYLGEKIGPLYLRIGKSALLPICHVRNCADAVLAALSSTKSFGREFNIVDTELPTKKEYYQSIATKMPRPKSLYLPWHLIKAFTFVIKITEKLLGGSPMKVPGFLEFEQARRRFESFQYPNNAARDDLGWSARISLREALRSAPETNT